MGGDCPYLYGEGGWRRERRGDRYQMRELINNPMSLFHRRDMREQQRRQMSRRGLLQASLLAGGVLAGCSTAPGGSSFEAGPPLVPIRARRDRIFDIALFLRPVP